MNPVLVAIGSMALITNFWILRERNGLKARLQRELESERKLSAFYQKKFEETSNELTELKLQERFEQGIKIGRKSDFLWQELCQQIEGEEKSAIIHLNHRKE